VTSIIVDYWQAYLPISREAGNGFVSRAMILDLRIRADGAECANYAKDTVPDILLSYLVEFAIVKLSSKIDNKRRDSRGIYVTMHPRGET